jgi:hypothetical protein
MIPVAGKAHTELLQVKNGIVKIPPKNGRKGATYKIKDLNTYPIDYPSLPRWLSILQVAAEKTIIDEESCEPITNRLGIGGITPQELYSWEEAIATQSAIALSKADHEMRQNVEPKKKSMSWVWVAVLGAIAIVAIVAFVMIKQRDAQETKDALGIGAIIWDYLKMAI